MRSLAGYGDIGNDAFSSAVDALLANEYADPFCATYASQMRDAIDSGAELSQALDAAPVLNTTFSAGGLSEALAQVARVISVRDILGGAAPNVLCHGGWLGPSRRSLG